MLRHSKGLAYLPVQENGRIAVLAIFEHAVTGIRKVEELGCPARPNGSLREFLPARQCKVALSELLHSGKQWMQNFSVSNGCRTSPNPLPKRPRPGPLAPCFGNQEVASDRFQAQAPHVEIEGSPTFPVTN
jgi:hypothetical protein